MMVFKTLSMTGSPGTPSPLCLNYVIENAVDDWKPRYSILARDIFNQNYALFIAAADGATFQPNPVSHVNSEHLAYFKFVGRIVGKAIADGQALDAHFTQSFYKVQYWYYSILAHLYVRTGHRSPTLW